MGDCVVAEETIPRYHGITAGLAMLNQLSADDRAEFDAAAKLVTRCLHRHGLPCHYRNRLFPSDQIDDANGVSCRMLPYRYATAFAPHQPEINWHDPFPFLQWAIRCGRYRM